MDDPQLIHFYRQYMQQVQTLAYPPGKLLLEPDVQDQIYRHFFDGPLKGPAAYQRQVLKQIVLLIERAIDDPNEDAVSDQLAEHMGYLSTFPRQDPVTQARETQVITYILPEPLETRNPPRILIKEAPNLLAAGSNVGLRTWEASLHLAQYLHRNPDVVRGKNVVELGAGTGLVSILSAGCLDAKTVLATDGLLHVVEGMEKNIYRNRQTVLQGATQAKIAAKVLDWGESTPEALDDALEVDGEVPSYDMILGADITYSPDVVPVLAQLLKVLMVDMFFDQGMEALISATVRNEKTLSVFREACVERGLHVEDVDFEPVSVKKQTGFFHEQAFPIMLMRIVRQANI